MGKILFWNVAGAGTGKLEELNPTLTRYASAAKPDCVVVCEMKKLKKGDKTLLEFVNYKYVKPKRPQRTVNQNIKFYSGDDDKRLYVYSQNPGALATQIATGNTRPVIHLCVMNTNFFLMHAPSVPKISKPQAEQMMTAYDLALDLAKNGDIAGAPVAIFGDLNVNLLDKERVDSLAKYLSGHALAKWVPARTGAQTHKGGSELDWALCDPAFKCKVTAIDPTKMKQSKKSSDEDMEWDGSDQPITKYSDHLPVLLEW